MLNDLKIHILRSETSVFCNRKTDNMRVTSSPYGGTCGSCLFIYKSDKENGLLDTARKYEGKNIPMGKNRIKRNCLKCDKEFYTSNKVIRNCGCIGTREKIFMVNGVCH